MLRHDSNVTRVAGTVFLSSQAGTVPSALLHNLKHNKVLHARNLFVTVRHHEVAHIPCRSASTPPTWAMSAAGHPALRFQG